MEPVRESLGGRLTNGVMLSDPFRTIAVPPPEFSVDEAIDVARRHYGLEAGATPLVSERDQNFLLKMPDGARAILKIANAAEPREVTEFQIEALLYIEAQDDDGVEVPAIIRSTSGRAFIELESSQGRHVSRLVTFLPGGLLEDRRPGAALARSLGRMLARLDLALDGFTHAGQNQPLLWDMKRSSELRQLLPHLADDRAKALVEATLDEFESVTLPVFDRLPWQVIHNDANPANVLVDDEPEARVSGLIDFGDMLYLPRIVEIAVAGAYLRSTDGNPLLLIAEMLSAYHAVFPVTREETDILHSLVKTRLASTVLILAWRASLRGPDDEYLVAANASETTALPFLDRLSGIPVGNAAQTYSQVCASAGAGEMHREDPPSA